MMSHELYIRVLLLVCVAVWVEIECCFAVMFGCVFQVVISPKARLVHVSWMLIEYV